MKKLFSIALASLILFNFPHLALAREVNNPDTSATPDAWSVAGGNCYSGGNVVGCEVAVDFNGNLLPTVTNAQTIGTSALVWKGIYGQGFTLASGAVTAAGTQTLGTAGTANVPGTGMASTPTYITANLFVPSIASIGSNSGAAFGVYASTTIPVLGNWEVLASSETNGGAVLWTATPAIATSTVFGQNVPFPDGTTIVIVSTRAENITLTDARCANGTGSQIEMHACTRIINKGSQPVEFTYRAQGTGSLANSNPVWLEKQGAWTAY